MLKPEDLKRSALCRIVEAVQQRLWLDRDKGGRPFWNPDKKRDATTIVALIAGTLRQHGLRPEVEDEKYD